MKRVLLLSIRVALIGAVHLVALGTAAAEEPAPPPTPPTNDAVGLYYAGHVSAVTKDSISILWPGQEKPKKFAASEILAAGKFPTKNPPRLDGGPAHTVSRDSRYRLADVKVGDRVYIQFSFLSGVDICDCIRIDKRPGGRVPPLPEGAENLITPSGQMLIPYHEYMNAKWDLEDKGIPFPEKFGLQRRWPVAPMPREKGTTGRTIRQ